MNAFARRFACQPGSSVAAHSGSVSQSSRTSIDDGVRWKTYSSFAAAPRCGTACTAVAPVPMIPTTLSERFSRLAPRVLVVPPRRVERVAAEGLHAGDAGELRLRQRAVRADDEPGPHVVAAIGADVPHLLAPRPTPSTSPWSGTWRARRGRSGGRSPGSARGSPHPVRSGVTGRSPSRRAAAGSRTRRRRRRRPGSGSSTTCRRRRRPRSTMRIDSTPTSRRRADVSSAENPPPMKSTSTVSSIGSRGTISPPYGSRLVAGEVARRGR